MHGFNGQGDKQWGINNAARWHWPYFVPFNLHWYFDAQCPRYSLAHRRFSRSLFKAWEKKEIDTSCLTEMTLLPKPSGDINENSGATYCIFFFRQTVWKCISSFFFSFYHNNENAKCLFDNWCWQLSACLEGELWEALTGGLKRQSNNLLFSCAVRMTLRSREKPDSPSSGSLPELSK